MTRTEYLLNRLVNVCGELSSISSARLIYYPFVGLDQGQFKNKIEEFAAVIQLLVQEGAMEQGDEFEKHVDAKAKQIEIDYTGVENRRAKGKLYQLKESPLTDLPKFYHEFKTQFPEVAKRKSLRVYESETTEPLMDLLHAHAMVLQEVKT